MDLPWSPYIGPPWTTAGSWPFALMLANDRAGARHRKQRIDSTTQEGTQPREWRISDVQ